MSDTARREVDEIRILQVTAPGPYGGRETVVRDVTIGLHDRGHVVQVLAVLDEGTDPAAHPFVAALSMRGVQVRPVVLAPRAYRAETRAIRQAADELEARIVHSHGYRADVVTALALGSSGTATVSTAHGFTGGGWKNRLYERLQSAAWRRFDAVVAVSVPLVGALESRGVDPGAIQLIPNAWRNAAPPLSRLEARRELGIEGEARALGWIGRLSPEKGPDVALEAVGRLGDRQVGLHFVGTGRMRGDLEARARELGIAERVTWHGPVVDAGRYMAAFDLLLLSSRTEGTPMVLLEAMGAKVPVVATAVGGIPDVLTGNSGLLVRPEDPEQLASAIASVLDDPVAAATRSECAAERLQDRYSVERWIARHEDLYAELVSSPHREDSR